MLDRDQQRLLLGAYLLRLMTEANGGEEPRTVWQWRRVARRFGVRLRLLPEGVLPEALLRRGQRVGDHGVIYLRRTRDLGRLRRMILHELAEAASRWEGVPPWVAAPTAHECASECVSIWGAGRSGKAGAGQGKGRLMVGTFAEEAWADAATSGDTAGHLSPAQRELLDVYRKQLDLWHDQTELMRDQTEVFREMAERIMDAGDQAEGPKE